MSESKGDGWQTPPGLWSVIQKAFGPFLLDPCAPPENNLGLPHFYTEEWWR